MNETQRAAAERLADDLQRFDGAERESLRDEAAALLRELLAEPQGEPVATLLEQSRQNCLRNFGPNGLADWIYTDLGELLADDAASMAILCKASEQVQRKPLTDKEIIALPAWDDYMGGCITLLDFARAVEKAHSITGEQE